MGGESTAEGRKKKGCGVKCGSGYGKGRDLRMAMNVPWF